MLRCLRQYKKSSAKIDAKITLSKVSASPFPIGESGMMPEFWTTASMLSHFSNVCANSCSTCPASLTSALIAQASPP